MNQDGLVLEGTGECASEETAITSRMIAPEQRAPSSAQSSSARALLFVGPVHPSANSSQTCVLNLVEAEAEILEDMSQRLEFLLHTGSRKPEVREKITVEEAQALCVKFWCWPASDQRGVSSVQPSSGL